MQDCIKACILQDFEPSQVGTVSELSFRWAHSSDFSLWASSPFCIAVFQVERNLGLYCRSRRFSLLCWKFLLQLIRWCLSSSSCSPQPLWLLECVSPRLQGGTVSLDGCAIYAPYPLVSVPRSLPLSPLVMSVGGSWFCFLFLFLSQQLVTGVTHTQQAQP